MLSLRELFWSLFCSDLCLSKEWNLCERTLALLSPTQKHFNAIVCLCICASVFADKSWNFRKVFTRCLMVWLDKDTVKHGAFGKHCRYTYRHPPTNQARDALCFWGTPIAHDLTVTVGLFWFHNQAYEMQFALHRRSPVPLSVLLFVSHIPKRPYTHSGCFVFLRSGQWECSSGPFLRAVSLNLAPGLTISFLCTSNYLCMLGNGSQD